MLSCWLDSTTIQAPTHSLHISFCMLSSFCCFGCFGLSTKCARVVQLLLPL
nr:MAG TPA: hypothetical protein [Caudoviricetes sp.]